jgi:hypothetical protein
MIAKIYLDLMGFDFIGEVDFTVTSWGSPDSWEEPGDPIEVEVDGLTIFRDEGKKVATPGHEVTGKWFEVLEQKAWEAACDYAYENGSDDDADDEYDRRRDERNLL